MWESWESRGKRKQKGAVCKNHPQTTTRGRKSWVAIVVMLVLPVHDLGRKWLHMGHPCPLSFALWPAHDPFIYCALGGHLVQLSWFPTPRIPGRTWQNCIWAACVHTRLSLVACVHTFLSVEACVHTCLSVAACVHTCLSLVGMSLLACGSCFAHCLCSCPLILGWPQFHARASTSQSLHTTSPCCLLNKNGPSP